MYASRLGFLYDQALSDDGALEDAEAARVTEVYTAAIDLTGRTPVGAPARISLAELGNHAAPAFAPDGKSIAYFTTQPSLPGFNPVRTLTIGDLSSGTERFLQPKLGFLDGLRPRWLPDSQSLVVRAADDPSRDRYGYFRLDVKTGAATPVLLLGHAAVPPPFQCSVDGRALLYADPKRGIVSREFATGDETTVIAARKGYAIGPFAFAPTGGRSCLHGADAVVRRLDKGSRGAVERRNAANLRHGNRQLVSVRWVDTRQPRHSGPETGGQPWAPGVVEHFGVRCRGA